MVIWYIFPHFGLFFPILVCCAKKNLATLLRDEKNSLFQGVSYPLCLSSSFAIHFADYSFWVHHFVNRDDRHLLAHAMASDFSAAWQRLSKRTICFLLQIKLYANFWNTL
jgi:hypothetical protein